MRVSGATTTAMRPTSTASTVTSHPRGISRGSAVDAYIGLFDRIGADDAIFSISNADDYQFRGSWNSPPTWRRLFSSNAPRSWTHDHPTEVFVRAAGDNRAVNAAIEAAYRRSLQRWVPPRYGVPTPMVEELDADRLLGPPAALVTADSRSFAGFEGRYR